MLETLEHNAAELGLSVETAACDASQLPFEDDSFDKVLCEDVLEHVDDEAGTLREIGRVLRPGGLLVLETINPASPRALRNYFADLTHAQPLAPETLELLVRNAGFEDVEVRYLNAPDPSVREVPLPAEEEWDAARAALAANARAINETLSAPLDYAILARRS
jgi:ubiquinone/menaquinone biosynthesis C-methylase UbiE